MEINMSERREIASRKEAIKFLSGRGTKVAVQVGFDGIYVFAEKTDFIEMILKGVSAKNHSTFVDYDGNEAPAFIEDSILYIPCGIQ
jgi:hypothetical protein